MKRRLLRPLRVSMAAFVVMLLVAFGLVALLAYRNDGRIERAQQARLRVGQVKAGCALLERALVRHDSLQPGALGPARSELARLVDTGGFEASQTGELLAQGLERLDQPTEPALAAGQDALRFCEGAVAVEEEQWAKRLDHMRVDTDRELGLALAAPFALLLVMGAIGLYVRSRIQRPLQALNVLVSRLAEGELTPIDQQNVAPLVLPLFENYNQLVLRLQELEQEHHQHAVSLTREVQAATRTVLEQHKSLSRAERLAATGELAASVAHEIRNPLAGILMALSNMEREVTEPDVVERLGLVVDELKRLDRLLTTLLSTARHDPEPAKTVALDKTVQQLLELTRHQLPPGIEVRSDIPEELQLLLPEDRLRQAVLNLVLNAVEAMPDGRGRVTVKARRVADDLVITVEDDGPGLPAAVLERRGRPFLTTREQGTGLGLAIVRRFTRDLGGRLELENLETQGARVTMRLPAEVSHV